MKTILVTGGGGFIGSNLVAGLLARGTHKVVICDAFGTTEKWRNLSQHAVHNIIEPSALFEWLESHSDTLDMVFHLGAASSTTEIDIDLVLEQNFRFSVRLWNWCNDAQIRFLYTSSSATYGDGSNGFEDNDSLDYLRSLRPMSGYGWSKHLFDVHVSQSSQSGQCPLPQWVGLKFFNVYGPNEYHKADQRSVINKMAGQAIQGAAVRLFKSENDRYEDGGQVRDMLYVKDAVDVMLWFLDHPKVTGLYNVGSGRGVSFNDMAHAIFDALGKPYNINYIDMPDSLAGHYQYFTEANVTKLRTAGYEATFSGVSDGVKDYVQNYLMQPQPYL